MKGGKRLRILCGELERCALFADVGCDHGYCSEYMLKHGLCREAFISDISAKSLKKAETLLAAYIEAGRVRSAAAAGLDKTDPSAELVLIAGMGGEEIVHILKEGFLPPKLVLQPMKNAEKVRAFLLANGYRLVRDYTFFAEGKFYDLIKAYKEEGAPAYTREMLEFGRDNILSPSEDFCKKLERDIACAETWAENAKDGREALEARIARLKELYDETCRRLSGDR